MKFEIWKHMDLLATFPSLRKEGKIVNKSMNFQISNFFMFSACAVHVGPLSGPLPRFHPHVVRHIPQLVTTFTSTHSIRDNLHWLDACHPKQSFHHGRPGGVFHPLMIRRIVRHVLTPTSTHYTIDDSS